MKKFLSFVLSLLVLVSVAIPAYATDIAPCNSDSSDNIYPSVATNGYVRKTGVCLRKDSSTSSDIIWNVNYPDTFKVFYWETGEDGYTWYSVQMTSGSGTGAYGYLRSDVVYIEHGYNSVIPDYPSM